MTNEELTREVDRLRRRVEALEQDGDLSHLLDDRALLPNTMLLSDSFLQRAFAVLGHYFVASLIIMVPLYALIFFVAIAIG